MNKNKYICFYKNKQIEIESDTSYHAQIKAMEHFHTKKGYDILVVLAEKDGIQIIHTPSN